jgi:MYXO-CTERM domain-containing protein
MRSLMALCALGFCSLSGHAQTTPAVSTVVAFSLSNPVGNLVKGPDGALYGTALPISGVAGGLVWRSTIDGSDVRTLYQLTADDAISPGSGLMLASDGLLYGTTRFGKGNDITGTGTVFRIAPDGTRFQIIFRFAATTSSNVLLSPKNTNGAYPEAELTEGVDGYLYGTATTGGPEGTGTVFKLSKDGTDFQLLKSFGAAIRTLTGFGGAEDARLVADPTNAANIVARVVKSATAESSAGVTVSTGANNTVGTIPFTTTSTRMTVRVYSPRAGIPVRLKVEDAAEPTRSVETEALTTLVNTWETLTFDFANQVAGTAALNLAYTYNRLSIFFDYGKTGAAGGSGTFYFDDVLFDASGGGSSFEPITFALACGPTLTVDGAGPAGPLVLGDDGLFYGTTTTGGPDGCGAIFRIGFDGSGFQVLRHFSAATVDATTGLPENADGATPIGGLIDGGDGVFYGTATQGGTEGRGVVYSITPAGVFTVLHVFNNANGARPLAELLLGTDGKLYGTTAAGGVNSTGTTTSFGTMFSIGRDGTGFTRLYSFDGSQGSGPGSQLLQLSSGVFVGLTGSSGSCGYGTLFRYSQAGDTVEGNRRCGRSDNNNGGGTAGLGLLALLGALALGRRRRD